MGKDKEFVDPEFDPAEVAEKESSEPTLDSPGDDAVLEQEELYEGINSDSLPSSKRE